MPRLDPEILTDFATLIFEASELPPDVARQVAESLVLANLSGHDSHGVIRIIEYVAWTKRGWVNPHGQLTVVREQPCILILDGDFGFGQVIGHRAMELGIEKSEGRRSLYSVAATVRPFGTHRRIHGAGCQCRTCLFCIDEYPRKRSPGGSAWRL